VKSFSSLAAMLVVVSSGCMAHEEAAKGAGAASTAEAARPAAAPAAAEPRPNFGTVHFPVSCSAPAQQQFDLALGALHSYFYPETVKAFQKVLEIDPTCAMAYWGIARSQPPNPLVLPFPPGTYLRGREAIAKGKALGAPTQRERDWLDAGEAYVIDPDDAPYAVRIQRYAKAMEQLASRYPDDVEAAIFYAHALIESADPHDKSYGNQYKAAHLLEKLARTHPNHPGITHYIIHAYDYSPIAGEGLAAANEYAKIAPSAPHALHMPSHIYSMLGEWKASIASNQATLAVARPYAARTFGPGIVLPGEPHSLDFMAYAYLQLGMDREAKEMVDALTRITKLNVPSIAGEAPFAAVPVRYALERGAWAEAAALPPRQSANPYVEAVVLFGRALGAARLGDPAHIAQARADIDRMVEVRARYAAKPDQGYWAEQTEVLIASSSAWLYHALKNDREALRLLREAADMEDASEKHVAMENRLFPAREQLGYLLLELQEPTKALEELQASLKTTPNRLRGFYGAAKAAEQSGQPALARSYFEKLRKLTAEANGNRPEIAEARSALASR
jgi:tetratricopeptide (TPR) repeat protein